MAIDLVKIFSGLAGTQYITNHDSNYTIIEDAINTLLLALGSTSGANAQVPNGLQQIFDRDGIIGKGSYLPPSTAPSNLMTIPAGAAWVDFIFAAKATTSVIDLTAISDGTVYLNVDSLGEPNVTEILTSKSLYSFTWTTAGDTITNIVLLVDILFDGNDYNDQLDSAATGLAFESTAERLESIELNVDTAGKDYKQDLSTTTGLTFGYFGGSIRNDNVITDTATGTTVLADDDTSFIEVDDAGVVTDNIVGFTAGQIPLFTVVTASGVITSVTDERTFAIIGGGGSGSSTLSFNSTGNVVASLTNNEAFDLTSFLDRGIMYKITITETGGVSTGTYDVRFYGKDTKVAADLLYSIDGIDSTADSRVFTDRMVVFYLDADTTAELHILMDNNDGAQSMTFTIDIQAEKFA